MLSRAILYCQAAIVAKICYFQICQEAKKSTIFFYQFNANVPGGFVLLVVFFVPVVFFVFVVWVVSVVNVIVIVKVFACWFGRLVVYHFHEVTLSDLVGK